MEYVFISLRFAAHQIVVIAILTYLPYQAMYFNMQVAPQRILYQYLARPAVCTLLCRRGAAQWLCG